ncbi:hypothetical protein MPDQ_003689 [Monascus purpureus]|uniref:Alpha/beta hydrolase fold-3 domain-containing protein n=1 Tax=Monascus purpureus TaxID=5098 RepID=A0A507R2Y6_MONPU|nr:hypothetical protein MPDQ_003689 [Monascus purpureus]BDD63019.1 hypothetical protein MAP00_007969 [Monascus purpureus]
MVTRYWLLPIVLVRVCLDTFVASLTGLLNRPKWLAYKRYVIYSLVRSIRRHDTKRLLGTGSVTTIGAYETVLRRHKLVPDIVPLDCGGNILWLNRPEENNGKVMLYLHGGGYTLPAYAGHVEILVDQVKRSQSRGQKLSVAMLEYALAPTGQYPVQLRQAAAALDYLLKTLNAAPSNIILAGDSAGGNLCLSLLSHISHPHPDLSIPRVDLKGEKLRGTLLISPWVTFDTSAPSIFSNRETDYLLPESLQRASKAFLGDAKEDTYNTPLGASVEWWEDLHIQDLGIIVSDSELFFDDIMAFSEKIKAHNPHTQVLVAPGEAHVQSVFDKEMKSGEPTRSLEYIANWVDERLA